MDGDHATSRRAGRLRAQAGDVRSDRVGAAASAHVSGAPGLAPAASRALRLSALPMRAGHYRCPMNCSANCRSRNTDGMPSDELKVNCGANCTLSAAPNAT
jgi:hypothetical protein